MNDKSITINLPSRFDFSHHSHFSAQINGLLAAVDIADILLDFSEVNYLDSAALGMIVYLHKKATSASKQVRIINSSGFAAEILHVANIDKVLHID